MCSKIMTFVWQVRANLKPKVSTYPLSKSKKTYIK